MFSTGGTPRAARRGSRAPGGGSEYGAASERSTPLAGGRLRPPPSAASARSARARGSTAGLSDAGTSPGAGMGASPRTAAAVHEQDKVLVRDDERGYVVLERRGLPKLLDNVLAQQATVAAVLDSATGYAAAVSTQECLVWQYQRRSANPTVYSFPPPESTFNSPFATAISPVPLVGFVAPSKSSTNDPGLLLVSPTGQLRFWPAVSLGLSSTTDRFATVDAGLGEGELVRTLAPAGTASFILTTSKSRLIRADVFALPGRRPQVAIASSQAPGGWGVGRLWTGIFGGGGGSGPGKGEQQDNQGLFAVAISREAGRGGGGNVLREGERAAYAISARNVQVWRVGPAADSSAKATAAAGTAPPAGSIELLVEQDLFGAVLEGIEGKAVGNEEWALNRMKVEVLDAQPAADGRVAVLASYDSLDSSSSQHGASGGPEPRSYAIVYLDIGTTMSSVTVSSTTHLAYQSFIDPRPLSKPRLSFGAQSSSIAFVVFADAVVMLSTGEEDHTSVVEELFPLRSPTSRFIGFSTPSAAAAGASSSTQLALLSSMSTIITISLASTPATRASRQRSITPAGSVLQHQQGHRSTGAPVDDLKTRKLKNRLEQAVYFGSSGGGLDDQDTEMGGTNPLGFDLILGKQVEGDVGRAAEAVSAGIVSGTSALRSKAHGGVILDLKANIADRQARAKALLEFVAANGLLGRLSQTERRKLSADAEKLAVGMALWSWQNSRMSAQRGADNLLQSSILSYMADYADAFVDDPIREFFRSKLQHLGTLVETLLSNLKMLLEQSEVEARGQLIFEATTILTLLFKAVVRHRQDTNRAYGIKEDVVLPSPWTSAPPVLEALEFTFDAIERQLKDRERTMGAAGSSAGPQADLKSMMPDLAGFLFAMYEERLLHLYSTPDTQNSTEARVVANAYSQLQPRILRSLVAADKRSRAFDLAEKHKAWECLVMLCCDAESGSEERTANYLHRHGYDFASKLYDHFVQAGQYKVLLSQDSTHRDFLNRYLNSHSQDLSSISWIQHITTGRFEEATQALVNESAVSEKLVQKKLIFSIAKLTQLADVTLDTVNLEPVQRAIEIFDDQLDIIECQSSLQGAFLELLGEQQRRRGVDEQAEAVTRQIATRLLGGEFRRPALARLYAGLVSQVLRGTALSVEGLVHLFALKDNDDEQQGRDYVAAIELLLRAGAKELPPKRKEGALQLIWRQIFIREDWEGLYDSKDQLSDEEVSQALSQTAAYRTCAGLLSGDHAQDLLLSPADAFFDGSADDLSPAYPGLSLGELDELVREFEGENAALRAKMERGGLEGFWREVRRLAREEAALQEGDRMEL